MKLKETTVEKHYLYRGKIVNFRCDDALLPDGTPCKREVVEHPGGASVLCVREGKILLVKQFRYAYGEELYEIPAGKLERGEDPAAAAVRGDGLTSAIEKGPLAVRGWEFEATSLCSGSTTMSTLSVGGEAKETGLGVGHRVVLRSVW